MSKRALKKYLAELEKEELAEQVLHLYATFKEVKTYYDFVFDPKEEKRVNECKAKITHEYFPVSRRRPRARRSVAQKYIKQFQVLGMSPHHIADVMWYNLEIATAFNEEKRSKREAFYRAMAKSFDEAIRYTLLHGFLYEFRTRIDKLVTQIEEQDWPNLGAVERSLELLEED